VHIGIGTVTSFPLCPFSLISLFISQCNPGPSPRAILPWRPLPRCPSR
jgi:hypothetical protein